MRESAHQDQEKASPTLVTAAVILGIITAGIYIEKHWDAIASMRVEIPGIAFCNTDKPVEVPCVVEPPAQ